MNEEIPVKNSLCFKSLLMIKIANVFDIITNLVPAVDDVMIDSLPFGKKLLKSLNNSFIRKQSKRRQEVQTEGSVCHSSEESSLSSR